MLKFEFKIKRLLATNKLESALTELMEVFEKFEKLHSPVNLEEKRIHNNLILLSARFHELEEKQKNGEITDYNSFKTTLTNSFISIIEETMTSMRLKDYLEDVEEEQAWGQATSDNTIEAYERYFENYPNGKYKSETQKIISDLKDIELRNLRQLKQRAEEERNRREFIEDKRRENSPESPQNYSRQQNQNLSYSPVPIGVRFGALLIDLTIYLIISLILTAIFYQEAIEFPEDEFAVINALVTIGLESFLINMKGKTLSKYIFSTKVAKANTYKDLAFGEALLRSFIKYLFLFIPTLVGYFISGNIRFWHDKIVDSEVVYE